MSTVADRISRELAADRKAARVEGITIGFNQGILQSIRQIVEKMIKMNLKDDFINQVTGAKKSEIDKIRKELNM